MTVSVDLYLMQICETVADYSQDDMSRDTFL